ncbi:hypothetical protein MTO96_025718 [Rhipicephalus appendiculatus]
MVMPSGALNDGVPSAALSKGALVARASIGDAASDLASAAHEPREQHAVWPARSALPLRSPGSHRRAVTRRQADEDWNRTFRTRPLTSAWHDTTPGERLHYTAFESSWRWTFRKAEE